MISPRLALIASLVPQGARLADVGTDHGYLPIYLVQKGIVAGGVATDLRPLPLASAEKHLREAGISSVRTVLCDGLAGVLPDEVDTVVIAGMGGDTIEHILHETPWLCDATKLLLLQPMSHADTLRRYLAGAGFFLSAEHAVEDGDHIYTVMVVRYTGECRELSEWEALTGALVRSSGAAERAYLTRLRDSLDAKAKRLADHPEHAEYYRETTALVTKFNAVLE